MTPSKILMQWLNPFKYGRVMVLTTLLCGVGLSGCLETNAPVTAPENTAVDVQWINTPNPEQVLALIPATEQTPVVMFVQADLCASCQTLKPKLRNVSQQFAHLPVLNINLNQKPTCESGAKAYQNIMEAFAPAVTPTLVFVQKGGKVQAAVVDDQTEEALIKAFTALDATLSRPEADVPTANAPSVNPNTVLGC